MKRDGATPEELFSAKRHLKGSILLSLESTVSRMSGIARQEYYFGKQHSPDEIIKHIDKVTLEDIQRDIAQMLCHRANATLDMQRFDFMTEDECRDTLRLCKPLVDKR